MHFVLASFSQEKLAKFNIKKLADMSTENSLKKNSKQ
jgi:hypothetical protein